MSDDDYLKTLEIQRRNFEAQFGSIEDMGYKDKSKAEQTSGDEHQSESDEGSDSEETSQFKGFESSEESLSDPEEDVSEEEEEEEIQKPKVVKLNSSSNNPPPTVSKSDRKLLRSGRAPTMAEIEKKERELSKLTKKQQAKAAQEDNENLENDIKLQRLLKESHILSHQLEHSGADLTLQTIDYEDPTGKARRKILTSRMRELAATNSSTGGLPKTLEKMPMAMRKGMIRSQKEKIAHYEEEARNAGIVLSKTKKGQFRDLSSGSGSTFASDRIGTGDKINKKHRQRGLKINSVGKSTRNGLIISKDEIERINNKGKSFGKKKRR